MVSVDYAPPKKVNCASDVDPSLWAGSYYFVFKPLEVYKQGSE